MYIFVILVIVIVYIFRKLIEVIIGFVIEYIYIAIWDNSGSGIALLVYIDNQILL